MPLTPYKILVFLSVFTLLCCSSATRAQQGSIHAAIEEGNRQWSAALSRGDSAGMAALYTPNAQLFPTHSDIVSGTEAIQKFWQGLIDQGARDIKLATVGTETSGNIAYEAGTFEFTVGPANQPW